MNAYTLLSAVEGLTPDRLYGWFSFGLSAVAVLAVLIVVHEFGHFITARLVGVRVEKFSIGFGRRIAGWRRGDTEYMVSWVPLGGYVKFYGDDPDAADADTADSFLNQAVWKRLMIVAAGPVFNIVLAVLIASAVAMIGIPEPTRAIDELTPDGAAAAAGLAPGDTIEAIDGVPAKTWDDIRETIHNSPGKEMKFDILREPGERFTVVMVPQEYKAKTLDGKEIVIGRIGVAPRNVTKSFPPHLALLKGAQWTWDNIVLVGWAISKMITRDIPASEIAGPIGIMQIAGKAAERGLVELLIFIAIISLNLGVLNLLPIPILDGGHIIFFSLEAMLGKPVQIKAQEIAQQVGLVLLISLMLFAFYNDIVRLLKGWG